MALRRDTEIRLYCKFYNKARGICQVSPNADKRSIAGSPRCSYIARPPEDGSLRLSND
jgi:hypothetical protein